ncbi:sensor histidine kinase [Clostridium estertheticum]|uniref:sensor histidine kinase n=1 Tax=Clostridium estertheticum TaxID=238834 RepID=UPI001C7DF017|nr:HAMP domain-containing sensor histidine kinase [Clostridium estertheticum]MBX4264320.1 HAMP domain-containing histidine kinase [Clostridium estertheticum]WLC89165.1 HAMP domain-containing histidine kinase [Clostridium estertheticum]
MKLKKWLSLSHLIIMLAPIITAALLFNVLVDYNKNNDLKDYLLIMSKFKVYEDKIQSPELYNTNSLKDKSFVINEDKNLVLIELYTDVGEKIYPSNESSMLYTQTQELYSDLYKVVTGYKAYTLKKPVFKDSTLIGFYKITIARNIFVKDVNNKTIIAIICFIIVLIIIYTSVILLLNRKFNKPIKLLVEGMHNFATGYGNTVKYENKDEIGEIITNFNIMEKDIEDKRKTIEADQNTKEYMISAISHDLKTPLTAVRAYSEAIINEKDSDIKKIKNKALVILNKSDYMQKMIDDLLMYNLLTTDYKMNFVEVDGYELFEMLFSGYDEDCEKNEIKLICEISLQGKYKVDVNQMTRVVDNLMSNALRYTPKKGNIYMGAFSIRDAKLTKRLNHKDIEELKLIKSEGFVLLIKNDGVIIPKEDKDKVFLPFYQCDDSRSKKTSNGVGLGLSIVNLVIKKHEGEVRIFSEDNSTVFACWIPQKSI